MGRKYYERKKQKTKSKKSKSEELYMSNSNRDKDSDLSSSSNDPNWYAANGELLRNAANIPFSWALGTTLGNAVSSSFTVPGIQTIHLVPSVGYSSIPSSPVNIAANSVYSFIRHANSGHSNYDAPDLMVYLLSMSQVYSYINMLQRVYGTALLYAQENRYFPERLLEAQKVDASSVRTDLAALRYGINLLINKASSFAVPANMSIFMRHAFLYQNLYIGGSTPKDQLYLYVPDGFWKYKGDTEASSLDFVKFGPEKYTVQALLAYGHNLIDPLISSEDFGIMSGDILKAYGQNIIKLQALPETYMLSAVHDVTVLEQMKNTIAIPLSLIEESLGVTHDPETGVLFHTPEMVFDEDHSVGANLYLSLKSKEFILTTSSPTVSPELVMENSRLMTGVGEFTTDAQNKTHISLICGSEIATEVSWFSMTEERTASYVKGTFNTAKFNEFVADDPRAKDIALNYLDMIPVHEYKSMFKFAPANLFVQFNTAGSAPVVDASTYHIVFDIDNYGLVTPQILSRLHETAILSELAVPSIAKV